MSEESGFRQWCILELMGHRRLAGLVTEVQIAGASFLRLDVPSATADAQGADAWAATQFYAPASVYCLTPTTESMARTVAAMASPDPVHRWELPSAEPEPDVAEPAEVIW